MVGDLISWLAGLSLLFFGGLVLVAYRPEQWPHREASGVLQAAIFFGFLAAVGYTLFWPVLGQPIVRMGLMSVSDIRAIGDWADLLFKGGGALSAWLHLKALHMSLPEKDRPRWGILEMSFYPKRRMCLRMLSRLTRKERE